MRSGDLELLTTFDYVPKFDITEVSNAMDNEHKVINLYWFPYCKQRKETISPQSSAPVQKGGWEYAFYFYIYRTIINCLEIFHSSLHHSWSHAFPLKCRNICSLI